MTDSELIERERAEVFQVCEEHGYGRVMQLAEQLWREKVTAEGFAGSEHTTGPCAVFMVPCPAGEHARAVPCDWCCGAGRVTNRVAEAIANHTEAHRGTR